MSIELEHVFDYRVRLKPPVVAGRGPFGVRAFYEVIDGEAEGPRLRGKVLGGGGDWALVGDDGWARLDVRGQLLTDDGAAIYIAYPGILELNEKVVTATSSGGGTGFGDQYFRSTPTFETGDERYGWLTQSVFVARGRAYEGGGVAYEVYRAA